MTASNIATIDPKPARRSVVAEVAHRYGMEADAFEATLRKTVVKGDVSREEFAALMVVANQYGLNPLTKEFYAFPAKGGGIQPIVSIDGWSRIINDHPAFDGMEFEDIREGAELLAITCRMHRKDRSRPIEATEYMVECKRGTDVWKQWPRRMLRHKAMIQCARYAFGFGGIVDQDEYERMIDVTPAAATRPDVRERLEARGETREGFNAARATEVVDQITGEITDAVVEPVDPPADDDLPIRDDTADDFPGDTPSTADPLTALRTGAELLADQAEQDPDFDPIDWAASFTRGLDQLPTVEEVAGAWKEAQKSGRVRTLKARNEGMAKALAEAVNARVAAINGTGE
ncbi:MAG: RecT family recombinase [Caulobacter sp.]|nr:RecT family recombinase [Caulobacter sp.]